MAASNAPKHDFAPAWLKIPAQENPKSAGSKQQEHSSEKTNRPRRDDNFHNSYNRYGPDYNHLHRQHSFDAYYETAKRFNSSGQPGPKYRHHSVEDDYYSYPYGQYGYYNGYGYEKFGMQYGSQPSLFRPPSRDGKYQHPNTRYPQVNGGYSGYYDLYSYDYFGDMYYNNYPNRASNNVSNAKKSYYEKEGRSNSREGKDRDGEKGKEAEEEKETPFSDDFPSLNGTGESADTKNNKPSGAGGVWDHHSLVKSGGSRLLDDVFDSKNPSGANIYKALVPNKASLARKVPKDAMKLNGGFKDPFMSGKPPTPTGSNSSGTSKDGTRQSPTPPLDILNTRFVTQPRNLGDKKSEFLRALKSENGSKLNENGFDLKEGRPFRDKNANSGVSKENEVLNGMDELQLDEPNQKILSSSLEAEQRLLREMGWNEQDDEDYEITEDDMKEFQKLTDMMKKQQRDGLRSLPKTWSPKHAPIFQPEPPKLNETLSSSDSDSDDDESS